MSTKRSDEELNSEQLSQVTGGEDGGFLREVPPGIGPTKAFFHGSDDSVNHPLTND